jgi:hypothetical protein
MNYSDNQQAIRVALWNFMGALLNSSRYEGEEGKQTVVALVSEELAKLCKNDDGSINMVVAKPILKNAEWVLESRSQEITKTMGELSMNPGKDFNTASVVSASLKGYIEKL